MPMFRPFAVALGGVAAAVAFALASGATPAPSASPPTALSVQAGLGAGGAHASGAVQGDAFARFLAGLGVKDDPDAVAQASDRREGLVHDCMAAQGLAYVPIDWKAVNQAVAAARDALAPTEADFLARYGYGVTAAATGSLPSANVGDPNSQVVASLDANGRRAYTQARAGCLGQAESVVPADTGQAVPDAVTAEIDAVRSQAGRDPRVAAAQAGWATCMAGLGFAYPNQGAIVADLQARVAAIRSATGRLDLGGLADDPTAPQGAAAALGAARDLEMGTAAADLACRPGLDAVRRAVQDEYESDYLATNGPRLAAMIKGAQR